MLSIASLALADTMCAGRAAPTSPELSGDLGSLAEAQPNLTVRIRQSINQAYEGLSNFVFREHIERFRGYENGENGRRIDAVNALVSVEREQEQYTEIHQGKKSRKTIADLSGAWSAGGYSSMLRDAKKAVKADPIAFTQLTELNGTRAAVIAFDVFDGQESSWEFVVGPTHYRLPFHGELWASTATGELLRITRSSLIAPSNTGIKEVRWTVDFAALELNGKRFTVPSKAYYSVCYLKGNRREWNLISLSDFHRYGAEMTVSFPEHTKGNPQ